MPLTLTIADLREYDACSLDERIADLRRVLPDVGEDTPVPLATWWALPTTSLADRWWSLRAAEPAPEARRVGVRASCRAARRVLHLTHPRDREVCAESIAAAEGWTATNAVPLFDLRSVAVTSSAAYAAAAARAAYYGALNGIVACAEAHVFAVFALSYAPLSEESAERAAQLADLDELLLAVKDHQPHRQE